MEEETMRTLVLCVTVLAFALSGAACKKKGEEAGGGAAADPCNHRSKCEKEEAMAPEDITECQAAMADKDCGPKAKAMTECMAAKEICTAEGRLDDEATMTACADSFGAYFECMKNKASAAPPAP
jgi:hypothetical protein